MFVVYFERSDLIGCYSKWRRLKCDLIGCSNDWPGAGTGMLYYDVGSTTGAREGVCCLEYVLRQRIV